MGDRPDEGLGRWLRGLDSDRVRRLGPGFPLRLTVGIVRAGLELAVAALPHQLGLAAARTGIVGEELARIDDRRGARAGLHVAAVRIAGAPDELPEAALANQERPAAPRANAAFDHLRRLEPAPDLDPLGTAGTAHERR